MSRRTRALLCPLLLSIATLATGASPAADWTALSEAQVLENAVMLENEDALSRESLEIARVEVATRLGDVGTSASLPLLDRYMNEEPQVVLEAVLHRRPEPVPLFPFDILAEIAAKRIKSRILAEMLAEEYEREGIRSLVHRIDTGAEPGHLASALMQISSRLSARDRTALLEAIERRDEFDGDNSILFVSLASQDKYVPAQETYDHLQGIAPLLLLYQSDSWGPSGEAIRQLALNRADTRSAAILIRTVDSREYWAAEDALIASRTRQAKKDFNHVLTSKISSPEQKRNAVLALMLQSTPESRRALGEALEAGLIPDSLRADVEGYLAE